jgi:hypothetical protein
MSSTKAPPITTGFSSDDSCSTLSQQQQQQQQHHPKEVRFATEEVPSVAQTIDLPPPENDALKSREDLLALITILRDRLVSLTIALSGERVLRAKKDKTIFKLAKQFNVKSEQVTEKEKEINALLAHQATLETEVSQIKKQLLDLHNEMDKCSREHHSELTTLQNANRILTQKYDDRIASIQSYHSKQSEELRRQILQSQLETDRVRLKYASLQMKCYPRRADRIVKRTMNDAIKSTITDGAHDPTQDQSSLTLDKAIYYNLEERRAIRFWRFLGFIFCLLILPTIALAHSYHVLSLDVLCAPSRPYTTLDSSSPPGFHYEAPWWLPSSSSSSSSEILTSTQRYQLFALVCEDRPYTRLEWVDMGIAGHKLVIWDNRNKNPILLDKRTKSVRILGSYIEFTNRSGKVEKKKAPWASHTRRKA